MNKLQWNFNRNSYIFIQENALENGIWKKASILSRPQCAKWLPLVILLCQRFSWLHCLILTLNLWGPSYLGLTRSLSWLLMPWLLTSPGHQQPWYWLCRIGKSLSYCGRIPTTCVISMWSNDIKCKYMFLFPLKNLACKGLNAIDAGIPGNLINGWVGVLGCGVHGTRLILGLHPANERWYYFVTRSLIGWAQA